MKKMIILLIILFFTLSCVSAGWLFSSEPQIKDGELNHIYWLDDIWYNNENNTTDNMGGDYGLLIPVQSEDEYSYLEAVIYIYNEESEYIGYAHSPYMSNSMYDPLFKDWVGKNTPQEFVINVTVDIIGDEEKEASIDTMHTNVVDFKNEVGTDVTSDYKPKYAVVELYKYDENYNPSLVTNQTINLKFIDE